jgi:hypothetical protein
MERVRVGCGWLNTQETTTTYHLPTYLSYGRRWLGGNEVLMYDCRMIPCSLTYSCG